MMRLISLVILLLSITGVARADLKVTTRNTAAGHSSQSTNYIKGSRQRMEAGMGIATIFQCDQKRMLQVNDNSRTYLITSLDGEEQPAEKSAPEKRQPAAKERRGGIVTYTVAATDTGERKQMFGFTARHIKSSMTKEASPEACDQSKIKIESDGWYIDFEYDLNCSSNPRSFADSRGQQPDCRDEIRYKQSGTAKLGYPLILTTTIYNENSEPFVTSMEVTDLSKTTLDQSLFEVPAGYREVKDFSQLYGAPSMPSSINDNLSANSGDEDEVTDARPGENSEARAGAVRVGVVTVKNRTDLKISGDSLQDRLINYIRSANIDAVELNDGSMAQVEAEATAKGCDYILFTDVAQFKKPSTAGKIGSVFGRAKGADIMKANYEARFDFRLFKTGNSTPQLSTAAAAKQEGSEEVVISTVLEQEASAVASEVLKNR
jgi:hypothetical protein